jgi:hypothetical protein
MKPITPFTKTDYPIGYSRKDCDEQLQTVTNQILSTKDTLKRLVKEQSTLRKELKDGGRMEGD